MVETSWNGALLDSDGSMGELTDVASAKRGVLGDLSDREDSPELLLFGAGVTSTPGTFLFSLAMTTEGRRRNNNERKDATSQTRPANNVQLQRQ